MRVCYDSTNPADIPTSAVLVAYYTDGLYAVAESVVRARFPSAVLVPISALGTNTGTVLDVETGDATPAQVPGWLTKRRAVGVDPTVYVNRSNIGAVRLACQAAGVAEPHYWLSTLDGSTPWGPGIVAIQFAGEGLSGGHYDLSDVLDYWPGVDPFNPNATAGAEIRVAQEDAMTFVDYQGKRYACFSSGIKQYISGPAHENGLRAMYPNVQLLNADTDANVRFALLQTPQIPNDPPGMLDFYSMAKELAAIKAELDGLKAQPTVAAPTYEGALVLKPV